MELLKILTDDKLPREKSQKVIFGVDSSVESFAKNLFYTMKMSGGIGLAAPQVGKLIQVIAVDTTPVAGKTMIIMINPVITEENGESVNVEGCLSFPEKKVRVVRSKHITVEFQDFQGNKKTKKFSDIDAVCIAHEIDHLNGIVIGDYESK